MKRLLIVCGVLLTLISCQQQGDDNKQTMQVSKTSKVFSLADSLTKYQNADSLFEIGIQRYYVGTANETAFALVAISDSTTALYQKEGNDWFSTDTLSLLASAVTITDLNGDNLKDVVMTYGVTGIGGNAENVSLLYYPTTHKFRHNQHFDLPNISYDQKSKLIRAPWWSGVVHPQDKMTYSLVGDSVALHEGVVYKPIEATQGATATVEFYTMQGTHRIVTKKVKGDAGRMFKIFEKALWNSEDEF